MSTGEPAPLGRVFEYFRELSNQLTGVNLQEDSGYLLEGRLAHLAAREKLPTADALVARLQRQTVGALHWEAVEAVTNKETLFFRDEALFQTLETQVLPEVFEKRHAVRSLRVWSAACSSGQEPYSLAMLLCEGWGERPTWDVEVLASDISSEALKRGQTGIYSEFEVTRGLSTERLARHFERVASGWSVRDTVRRVVRFRRINLAAPGAWSDTFDVVLLRNVMLYFDAAMRRRVLEKVHECLAPGGYLFLGAAENLLFDQDLFTPFVLGRTVGFSKIER